MIEQVADEPFRSLHHESLADLLQSQPKQLLAQLFRTVGQAVEGDDFGQSFLSTHPKRTDAEFPRKFLVVTLQNFAQNFSVDSDCVEERAVDVKYDVRHRLEVFAYAS